MIYFIIRSISGLDLGEYYRLRTHFNRKRNNLEYGWPILQRFQRGISRSYLDDASGDGSYEVIKIRNPRTEWDSNRQRKFDRVFWAK